MSAPLSSTETVSEPRGAIQTDTVTRDAFAWR
jgi:hypothetical protein